MMMIHLKLSNFIGISPSILCTSWWLPGLRVFSWNQCIVTFVSVKPAAVFGFQIHGGGDGLFVLIQPSLLTFEGH